MNPNPPGFQVWLTVAVCSGWAILTILFARRENWTLAAISAVSLILYCVRLYLLTKRK